MLCLGTPGHATYIYSSTQQLEVRRKYCRFDLHQVLGHVSVLSSKWTMFRSHHPKTFEASRSAVLSIPGIVKQKTDSLPDVDRFTPQVMERKLEKN